MGKRVKTFKFFFLCYGSFKVFLALFVELSFLEIFSVDFNVFFKFFFEVDLDYDCLLSI